MSGRTRPAMTCRTVDLPAPFGPRTASTSPAATSNSTSTPRLSTTPAHCTSVMCALTTHWRPRPAAPGAQAHHDDRGHHDEQQRQRDRGVGIALPLQVDLQRQGAGDALARSGERQRGAELAQRAGECQHRAGHQAGRQQRQRHPPPHGGRPRAEGRGDHLVIGPRGARGALERDDQERQRHERLRQHHRRGRERDVDARGLQVVPDAAPAGRTRTAARCPRRPAAAPAAAGSAAGPAAPPGTSLRASTSAIGTPSSRHSAVLAAAVSQAQHQRSERRRGW